MSLSSSSSEGQLGPTVTPPVSKPRLILRASPPKALPTDRKFTSDFFGRNKSETTAIPEGIWAFVSRKEYQRSKYASEKSAHAYRDFWLSALKTQLVRLRLWRPEATYEVKLLSRARERLSTYNSELLKNGHDVAAAQRTVHVGPTTGKKGIILASNSDAIDPVQAQHIETTFAGIRSIDYILDTILPWIERSLRSGALTRMPPVEFLIQPALSGDTINEPSKNYQMWRDYKEPKWTRADHQAAVALMSLSSKLFQPMITTWGEYNAAMATDAARRAALTKATPNHTADSGSESLSSTATIDSDSQQKTVTPAYKGKGKRRMIDEDEAPEVTNLVYNARRTANKKQKIGSAPLPTPLPRQKPRVYTSMTMMKGRQVCEVRGQDD